ncbi:MAG: hypothetical protein UT34_C0002G0126 [candidate division WS6 bacterium GW2011_GWF2_39_15]|uniref:Phosphoesterase RecJ domain protein n=1 Tax=candidate division WS6 bacterium GW2011_GWF2_39_15 TaxID=1619100 RepID=A0A0G0MNJ3_9BACT|nr:MAG: hypothetical protein UT34_C0002G0126 [candidate division WS6 bacterium GW2011_GWF2_39_15]
MPLKTVLAKSKNILIIGQDVDSFDKACSLIALYKTLKTSETAVELMITGDVPSVVTELFEKNSTLYVTEIHPLSYEITIDYGQSSIEKIIYDDIVAQKKLKFVITPGNGAFSFDSVKMSEGGSKFDLIMLFDIEEPKALRNLYDQNEYLFKEISMVSVGSKVFEKADEKLNVGEGESYSEVVYNKLKAEKIKIGKESVEILLNGIVNFRRILEGKVSSSSWEVISSMVTQGADLSQTLREVYFSKSKENTALQVKLMQNIKTNHDYSLIWSLVSKKEFDESGLTESELDIRGRIPFNLSDSFDLAVAAYEVEDTQYKVVIESNNPEKISALKFATLFGCEGDDMHAECRIKFWKSDEFEKKLLETLDTFKDEKVSLSE